MKARVAIRILSVFASLFAVNAVVAQSSGATNYPTRPLRLVVPFGPGGGSDYVGRVVAQQLAAQLGQSVVVDNRPGAASLVGTEIVARAAADGYTLCLCDVGFTINPAYYKKTSYDPIKDFDPVMVVAETPYILVVNPGLPYASSIKSFIAAARTQPGQINLGSAGNGSGSHFAGELFKQRAGVTLTHVPYKSTGASGADVAAGQIQASMSTPPAAMPMAKAGRLKIVATAGAKRSPILPDVPTFEEAGVGGAVMTNWYSVMSVGGTPQPVLKRLHEELYRAVNTPEMRDRLATAALEPAPNTPEQFRKLIVDELQRWKTLMKNAGIKPE